QMYYYLHFMVETRELSVHVMDLNRDVTLRVTGEVHIGGVMLKLVEKLDPNAGREPTDCEIMT
uniref:Kindlin-2 N-terminal domain-containing protein n=1 Tax=Suricata suricatta TaxID=37032 RepID=A0A673TJI8_SURSU